MRNAGRSEEDRDGYELENNGRHYKSLKEDFGDKDVLYYNMIIGFELPCIAPEDMTPKGDEFMHCMDCVY